MNEKVKITKLKTKKNKKVRNGRSISTRCTNCGSSLLIDFEGHLQCTGDKLDYWIKEFEKYHLLTSNEQVIYMKKISNSSKFEELYDYWRFSKDSNFQEPFKCGFTNGLNIPLPTNKVKIPDPLVVKAIEEKLGRNLTEGELKGEELLYSFQGIISTEYVTNSKTIKIPQVILPDEVEVK